MSFKLRIIIVVCTLILGMKQTQAHHLQISDTVVRAAIPGMKSTAGFLTIENRSAKDEWLVAARSKIAQKVEFHKHEMAAGQMKMVKVDQILLPANSEVKFESGGLHLMFISLIQQPEKFANVEFETKSGLKFTVKFDVKSILEEHKH